MRFQFGALAARSKQMMPLDALMKS
jgi:hypothetical protein